MHQVTNEATDVAVVPVVVDEAQSEDRYQALLSLAHYINNERTKINRDVEAGLRTVQETEGEWQALSRLLKLVNIMRTGSE